MSLYDLHVHTRYCDGADTPEEMILAAIDGGLDAIGFSAHSHTPFDTRYCLGAGKTEEYRREIFMLREKYRGRIRVFCGIEQDLYSGRAEGFDYVIGSVHYLRLDGEYVPVDDSPEILLDAADRFFGGDMCALAVEYFSAVSRVVEETGADIIGHFDLITKFNENGRLFDETDERYVKSRDAAAISLLKTGKPFEVNTGAIARGYRSVPYPCTDVLRLISAHGGGVIMSGDSHSADTLCFQFGIWEPFVRDMGVKVLSLRSLPFYKKG